MSYRPARSVLRGRAVFGVATLACLGAALVNASPAAVSAPDAQCPAPYPVASLAANDPVHGLTVSHGTTPDAFTGTVLGVLNDGIAPGLDMVMVDLTSPEVDRVGIWAGMSGSPVYAEDGRLIGAVAYGLSFGPSTVAGVTPAADMEALLDAPPAATTAQRTLAQASATRRVAVPGRTADRLVAAGDLSRAQATAGFTRLPLPFGVSGMIGSKRLTQANKLLGLKDVRVYHAGAVSAGAPLGSPTDIVAGGNLAASVSYGDVTSAGIGTATAVCNGEVLAFGHPMLWTGPSELTMHGADALYIQSDPTFSGFKVANLSDPVGSITQDRLAGIHGVIGSLPPTTTIDAHVKMKAGATRDGVTNVSVRDATPEIAALTLLADEDRVFDGPGAGSGRVRWTVEGLRSDGTPFEFSRVNHYVSHFDITFETIFESLDQISRVLHNKFDDVSITHVSYRAHLNRTVESDKIVKLQRHVHGAWHEVANRSQLRVHHGSTLKLRAVLRNSVTGTKQVVPLTFQIPAGHRRSFGFLEVSGGDTRFGRVKAHSFGGLLKALETAPHNNDVTGALLLSRHGADHLETQTSSADKVVQGRKSVELLVH